MARYIDADALQKRMLNYYAYSWDLCEEIKGFFERTRTSDVVERKSGKWEIDSDTFPICSKCGEIALQRIFVKVPHLIQDVRMVRSNYCPNCGADMRGEQHD